MRMMMFRLYTTTGKSQRNKKSIIKNDYGGPEMKLKRAWPAILIWAVFLIFIIAMVVSYSFFLGLFPSYNALEYSIAFSAVAILIMSVLTVLLGRVFDSLLVFDFAGKLPFRIMYGILIGLIIIAGFWYRVDMLSISAGEVTGKISLYENAMIGAAPVAGESDLLSIAYTGILRLILFFTGNIISVPFFFQIVCFTIFMICGFFTAYKLLGMLGGLVFTSYVAFMPVFTVNFTGLELSTDSLFMAMFGIEFLLVALFLRGAYRGVYNSKLWAIWYVLVGLAVGYMAYVDAGTIIMILPFLLSGPMLYGRKFSEELKRLLILLAGAVAGFFGMIIQEAGIGMVDVTLVRWGTYYFHNLNTFSTFWTYTDYKMIYLVTVVAMSGIIVGFWKNRKVDIVSPWLLSMLFIFATVPFMGATRMNTQVFVTVYYAYILACVAALIALPANAGGEAVAVPEDEEEDEETKELQKEEAGVAEVVEPEERNEAKGAESEESSEAEVTESEESSKAEEAESEEGSEAEVTESEESSETEETESEVSNESEGTESAECSEAEDTEPEEGSETDGKESEEGSEAEVTVPENGSEAEEEPESDKSAIEESEVPEDDSAHEDKDDSATEDSTDTAETAKEEAASDDETEDEYLDEGDDEDEYEDYEEPEPIPISDEAVKAICAGEVLREVVMAETVSVPKEESPREEPEKPKSGKSNEPVFIPEGMVLPMDDEDVDQTPRMKMPQFKGPVSPYGKVEKLKVGRTAVRSFDDLPTKDDFDIPFKPGDDFDT